MISIERYFKNPFDDPQISDDEFAAFVLDALQKMIAANGDGRYDDAIAFLTAAYDEYFGAITDEDSAAALQKARTAIVDRIIAGFKDQVSRREGRISDFYGSDSPSYLEFFPLGLTEYRTANKENIETLMKRIADKCADHVADVGQDLADEFAAIHTNFKEARKEQLKQIGLVKTENSQTAESRSELELMMLGLILARAQEYKGQPEKATVFFFLINRSWRTEAVLPVVMKEAVMKPMVESRD